MAKTKISEFSSTPGNNTDIDGINIAEGCAPSGINNAIRELMSQLKDFQAGTAGDSFNGPVGTTTAAAGAFTTLTTSSTVTHNAGTANGVAYLNGSKVLTTGSALTFDGTNLGVGQATPTVKLQVDTASASGDLVGWFRQSTFPVAGIRSGSGYAGFGQSAASSETRIYADGATSFITNYLGGSEQMRLTSTGLGIGTSSPNTKLQVNGNAVIGNGTIGAPASGYQLRVTNDGSEYYDFGRSSSTGYFTINASQASPYRGFIWAYGGTSQMTLDSSGNLGLGVTPSAWGSGFKAAQIGVGASLAGRTANYTQFYLMANSYYDGSNFRYLSSAPASYYHNDNGAHIWTTAPSGTAGNAISFTQAMTLDASGNLGIGTTSPQARLSVRNNLCNIYLNPVSNAEARIQAEGETAGVGTAITFYTYNGSANGERARIDSSGNLLVGTTSASDTADLGIKLKNNSGDPYLVNVRSGSTNSFTTYAVYSTGAGAYRFYVGMGGTIYATSTSISAISDATLKENVRDLETGLTEVMALRPRRFDWKNGDAQNVAGFVAQEVEQVLPELVTDYVYNKDEDGNDIVKKSLKMGDILPTLVKAIQEQQAIITALTARVAALESN